MSDGTIWWYVLAIGVGTFVIRSSVLLFAHHFVELPAPVRDMLRLIPPAVFAALVVPTLLRSSGSFDPLAPEAFAGVVAAAVAWFTRNVIATVVVGMATLMALRPLLG